LRAVLDMCANLSDEISRRALARGSRTGRKRASG
jgi:hypothetical protein